MSVFRGFGIFTKDFDPATFRRKIRTASPLTYSFASDRPRIGTTRADRTPFTGIDPPGRDRHGEYSLTLALHSSRAETILSEKGS